MAHFSSLLCNNEFTICISNDYNVFSFGGKNFGAHGHEEEQINIPTQINNLNNIKMIYCGSSHTVCLNYDGDVFSFGRNSVGQLGIGLGKYELEQTHIPQKINIPPCKQVSCGNDFTVCVTEDNKLFSFGKNTDGQLGLANHKDYLSPQLIPDFNNIEYIICGRDHSTCKTYNNEFYSWGSNKYGQLGQGNYKSYNKPIQCINWPDNIIDIKSGNNFSLLLTEEGKVYSVGSNFYGQLGLNKRKINSLHIPRLISDIPEIQRIECGNTHSMCIDINNNIWLFGCNTWGQLGLQHKKNMYKPILNSRLSNIIDISSGGYNTFVKTIDNTIYAFGRDEYSQLGIETSSKQEQLIPIQVLEGREDIWCSFIGKSKAKSARK